jgi:hypothetical protein
MALRPAQLLTSFVPLPDAFRLWSRDGGIDSQMRPAFLEETPMGEMTLDFLGKQVGKLQTDIRDLRAEMTSLKAEMDGLHAYVASHLAGLQVAIETRIDQRIEALEARIDAEAAAVQAQFAQVHETMATNLQAVLAAIGKTKE